MHGVADVYVQGSLQEISIYNFSFLGAIVQVLISVCFFYPVQFVSFVRKYQSLPCFFRV